MPAILSNGRPGSRSGGCRGDGAQHGKGPIAVAPITMVFDQITRCDAGVEVVKFACHEVISPSSLQEVAILGFWSFLATIEADAAVVAGCLS